jgi:hypothetical protein
MNQRFQQQQESEESQSDEESQSEQEKSESDIEDEFVEAKKSRRSEIISSSSSANSENYEVILSEQTSESRPQSRRNSSREGRRASERSRALAMKHVFVCATDIMDESLIHHAAMNSAQSDQWIMAEEEELNSLDKAET